MLYNSYLGDGNVDNYREKGNFIEVKCASARENKHEDTKTRRLEDTKNDTKYNLSKHRKTLTGFETLSGGV